MHAHRAVLAIAVLAILAGPLVAASTHSASVARDVVLERLELTLTIREHVAITHIVMVFHNNNATLQESLLKLPLDPTSVLTNFTLTTHNATYVGVVQEKSAAGATYNASKAAGRSAVLLNSAGNGLLSLNVAIPGLSTVRLDATVAQVLPLDAGVQSYSFPLDKVSENAGTIGRLVLDIDGRSANGWKSATLTGVPATPLATGSTVVAVHYEATTVQAAAPLALTLTPNANAYTSSLVLSGRAKDAALLLNVIPRPDAQPIPLDVVFILDRSGSMQGDKIVQARLALATIVDQLRDQDRFSLVSFSGDVAPWPNGMKPATEQNRADARTWITAITADGGTNIEGALSEALRILRTDEGPGLGTIVLITDGAPTVGVTEPRDIITSVARNNTGHDRIHAVGIGLDQKNAFLGQLAEANQGFYDAIDPNDKAAEALEDFHERISSPVLRDVTVTFAGLTPKDVQPSPLPDVYAGSHLTLAARADTDALPETITVVVEGTEAGATARYAFTFKTADVPIVREASALWARLKATTLERNLDVGDPAQESSTRSELLALGLARQIETRLTSWVVVELVPTPTPTLAPTDPAYHLPSHVHDRMDVSFNVATTGTPVGATTTTAGAAGGGAADKASNLTKTPGPLLLASLVALGAAIALARRKDH